AQMEVPNYFRFNRGLSDSILAALRDVHAAVKSADTYEKYQQLKTPHVPLTAAAFSALKALTDEAGSNQFKQDLDQVASRLVEEEMIEKDHVEREEGVRSTAAEVELDRGNGKFVPWPKEKLTYAVNPEHVDAMAETLVKGLFPAEIRPVFRDLIKKAVLPPGKPVQPVYVFDNDQTRQVMAQAMAVPPVMDSYRVGDRLVRPGVIDGESLALLKSEHDEYQRQRSSNPDLRAGMLKERLGMLGLTMLICIGLAIYSYRCQPRAVIKTARSFGIASLLIVMLLADRYLLLAISPSASWTVATVVMTAAILTLSYSQLFAIGAATALALLTMLLYDASFGLLLVLLTSAAVTILLLGDIRTRLRMVEVGGVTALGAAVSTLLVGLVEQETMRFIIKDAAFAAVAALAGISIVLVLLPIIERIFRITTSLTLLEWADASNPLLRQLIESAPGTWQHSHLLGSMAESAANEIGANGLLVRVGAYYHDIGKMCKPNYFVENQARRTNAHRGLAPTMSLLVILAHVKDGLALAREHGLPPALHPFIAEHHGTTVVRYFHSMAAQEARAAGRDEREVSETEFRYPGPKPHSPETAILMLCDGVEGAVRALAEPTPSRIETVVHEVFMARLLDGQFDDCDITLKELSRVEQSLVRSLCSIYHGRVAYPAAPESEADQGSTPRGPGEPKRMAKVSA
ncbi:MAG TPA: HDIG domain-containing protein, partial [Phycisphaerae bacterium]|nr:HDIG domain-containing protein [Phycisphaerae bacterium]